MPEIPVFDHDAVLRTVEPLEAIDRVRHGFVEYASGEWAMPPKTYLDASPHGDFRAMPASVPAASGEGSKHSPGPYSAAARHRAAQVP